MTLVAMSLRFDPSGFATGLVFGCDKLLSNDSRSVELPYGKIRPIGNTWVMGYSGLPSDFLYFESCLPRADEIAKMSADVVAEQARQAYVAVRKRWVEGEVLSPYGLDLATFRESGLATFGREKFAALCHAIESYDLQFSVLVGGWQEGYQGHIFRIDNPGVCTDSLVVGFDAIGSGSEIALGHLSLCHHHYGEKLSEAAARILEAKFMAEAQRNVGQGTVVGVRSRNESALRTLSREQIEAYRKRWLQRQRSLPESWTKLLE